MSRHTVVVWSCHSRSPHLCKAAQSQGSLHFQLIGSCNVRLIHALLPCQHYIFNLSAGHKTLASYQTLLLACFFVCKKKDVCTSVMRQVQRVQWTAGRCPTKMPMQSKASMKPHNTLRTQTPSGASTNGQQADVNQPAWFLDPSPALFLNQKPICIHPP